MAQNTPAKSGSESTPATRVNEAPARQAEETSLGKTTISSTVVQKIGSIAAREVSGVHALGGGMSRAVGAIKERIPGAGTASTTGVAVEVGEKQAAIDLDLVIEYGAAIADVARVVRKNVITSVERMTGLEVIEVNLAVNDVYVAEDDEENAPSRVE
ncbi:putative alkaline shock family protein YloU [Tamaricihabitans halophyticus]|uniref:Putative alkaline shock family protein YloU n=1 Tax=Tamaricihabitans halophyticus TaxID=1262583 RepID=A0A4R2QYJ8_9PSEU|nr:Asp23/Gls24 family envelope stress response protein [Tamaricihabitans halophyticus]TCP55283.1 putative alkaline shock family protein YloU [Tamaricihabitans halophyticus]